MKEKLREAHAAESEILGSIRLVHGDHVADGLHIVADQARLAMAIITSHIALMRPDVSADVYASLQESTRSAMATLLTGSVQLVLRDVDDPATRASINAFAATLVRRAVDDVVTLATGSRP